MLKLLNSKIVFKKNYAIQNLIFVFRKVIKTSKHIKICISKLTDMFVFEKFFIKFQFFKFQKFDLSHNCYLFVI